MKTKCKTGYILTSKTGKPKGYFANDSYDGAKYCSKNQATRMKKFYEDLHKVSIKVKKTKKSGYISPKEAIDRLPFY